MKIREEIKVENRRVNNMKKVILSLAATLASASMMLGVAGAATTGCDLVNTGSSSNNTCTVTQSNDLKVTCTNDAEVVFVNNQSANSGSVTLTNNTNGGYAYSGNAVNTNNTTGKLDVSCGAKVASSPTPSPTPAPTTPSPQPSGQGAGQVQAAALPNTGSNQMVGAIITAGTALVILTAGVKAGFLAYRHFALK
jgi:hypothetical protein